jgi:hypothetical protein
MHSPILKFVLVALAAAFCAALTMFFNFKAGRDSWDEGKRALVAQFLGWWIGDTIFFWSFTIDSTILRGTLWGAAALAAIGGITLGIYLSNPPKVQGTPNGKPSGTTTDPHP